MGKRVSPMFAVIVILVVLAIGALYFMKQYRDYQNRWNAESAMLRKMAEQGRSRRAGGGGRMAGRRGAGTTPGAPAKAPGGGEKKTEEKPASK